MQAKEGQRGPSRFGRDALISPQSSIGLYRESSGSYDEGFVSDTKPADKRPNRQARQGKPWRRGGRLERHKVPLLVVLIPQGQGVGWGWGLKKGLKKGGCRVTACRCRCGGTQSVTHSHISPPLPPSHTSPLSQAGRGAPGASPTTLFHTSPPHSSPRTSQSLSPSCHSAGTGQGQGGPSTSPWRHQTWCVGTPHTGAGMQACSSSTHPP